MKWKWILCLAAICLLASACSSKDVVNALSANALSGKSGDGITEPETFSEDLPIHSLGESFDIDILLTDTEEQYACIVEQAAIYDSIDAANLNEADIMEQAEVCIVDADGASGLDLIDAAQYAAYAVVVCDIRIKNIAMDPDFNITEFGFVWIAEDEQVTVVSYPVYFEAKNRSEQTGQEYHCAIPVGEEETMRIGWLVDTTRFPAENLYLQVSDDTIHYVDLGL